VLGAVLGTLAVVLLALNLSSGERKIDHRIPHLYRVGDAQFVRSMGTLLGPPLVGGNTVVELVNGDRIFPAMLEAIRSARRSVTFETYIYWSGRIGGGNRSFRLNDEANLNVLDRDFARQLTQTFEADKALSHRITLEQWRRRPWSERAVERVLRLFRSQM